jgi:hypothetical protein
MPTGASKPSISGMKSACIPLLAKASKICLITGHLKSTDVLGYQIMGN